MDIYIMGNKVDYTIENEKTVKDIIDSITEIVNSYGQSITEIRIDGKQFLADDPKLSEIKIENVNNLEVETASFFEISSSLLVSLIPFTETLKEHIIRNKLSYNEFDQAKSWISDVLITSINVLFAFARKSDIIHRRNEIVKYILDFQYNNFLDDSKKEEFLRKLDEILLLLKEINSILNKISDEGGLFFDTTIDNDLSELLRLIDDIPTKLQLGKDKEAMEEIYEFSEIFISLIEFIEQLISSSSILPKKIIETFDLSKFKEVNYIIESLVENITSKDFVSASDTILYELKPLVEDIQKFIFSLREVLFSQMTGN